MVGKNSEIRSMVEGEDTGCLSELEKKGLHQAGGILENYGITSETDVSLLDQGDRSTGQKGQDHFDRRRRELCKEVPSCCVQRVGSVMLAKFCSHSQVSKESLSPSIHIGGIGLATCFGQG